MAMTIESTSVDQYLERVPERWAPSMRAIRTIIKESIPKGFEETISFSMIGYVVPKSRYPAGYHANKDEPLPFIALAAQKNHVSLYHLGIYAKRELYDWLVESYQRGKGKKLDIGKSCMRFRNEKDIPFDLIRELVAKISVEEWIRMYEEGHPGKGSRG